ncbi:MAG: hypothetical protein Q8N63_08360 [Nanoarchaeota archaeon]|nr:hypothetical protein [Nanoarchaeota archaeon]
MKKPNIDKKSVEIAMNILNRELSMNKGIASEWYLWGYTEAICAFLWEYTGIPLWQLRRDDYDDFVKEAMELEGEICSFGINNTDVTEINDTQTRFERRLNNANEEKI